MAAPQNLTGWSSEHLEDMERRQWSSRTKQKLRVFIQITRYYTYCNLELTIRSQPDEDLVLFSQYTGLIA